MDGVCMQNFMARPPVAVLLSADRPVIGPGVKRLRADEYRCLCEAWTALDLAKTQADAIVGRADEVRMQAMAEGMKEGRRAARDEMIQSVTAMRSTLRRWVLETEPKLVELVARCVREIVTNVETLSLVRGSVGRALGEMVTAPDVRIQVHESHVPAIREQLSQLIQEYDLRGVLRVEASNALQPGDCVVESPLGLIDLRVDSQLRFVEQTLKPA
jgi:flagellar biosynthesis/type III secretory pathway protein FliH